jgi:hypothetical protein
MAVSSLEDHATDLSPIKKPTTTTISRAHPPYKRPTFPFLSLPIELRLKIYAYLLPPRTHTIVSDNRPTGLFYNSTPPSSSSYPFGSPSPSSQPPKYRILTTNFHSSFPSPSIYPQLLRASKQLHSEAEPLLYGHKDTLFDFGTHSDALISFFSARSREARGVVRRVRVAKEVHCVLSNEDGNTMFAGLDGRWIRLGEFVSKELRGLRELDLVVWSSSGRTFKFPYTPKSSLSSLSLHHTSQPSSSPPNPHNIEDEETTQTRWRTWEWASPLLSLPSLRLAKIITWDFQISGKEAATTNFDSWLAERMVADELTRGRMVREGLVREGFVEVKGLGA